MSPNNSLQTIMLYKYLSVKYYIKVVVNKKPDISAGF